MQHACEIICTNFTAMYPCDLKRQLFRGIMITVGVETVIATRIASVVIRILCWVCLPMTGGTTAKRSGMPIPAASTGLVDPGPLGRKALKKS